ARCLALAAAIERASEHVLARAFEGESGALEVCDARTDCGRGVEAMVDGTRWRIGSAAYVAELSRTAPSAGNVPAGCTRVLLGNESRVVAEFAVGDELRADA